MIAELIDFLLSSDSTHAWKGIVCLSIIFFGPLFAAIWLRPTAAKFLLGLLAIALAYVVDFILSASIVTSQNLELDRFPANVELVLYGIVAFGWLIGSAIGGFVRRYGSAYRARKGGNIR